MTTYIDNIPREIPVALLQSAAGTAGLSLLWGDSIKKTAEKVCAAVGAVALNSFVSAPIANHLFSNKSASFRDGSSLGISLLVIIGLARLINEDIPINFSASSIASSIVLGCILNANRKDGEAITLV